MKIRFYNTLTHRVEAFEALSPPDVSMYNCGPTVYDYAHIGNFRAFVFADVLRRFLELVGYRVRQVMNITDVGHMTEDQLADGGGEDKMQVAVHRIAQAKKDGQVPDGAVDDPSDPLQVAWYYTDAFVDDARRLRLKIADEQPGRMPRATDHIEQMQAMIAVLIERGHAYVAGDGAVYYDVQSFPAYGALSGNTLDRLRGGAGGRVSDEDQAAKKHPADFLLWKPDESHLMKWASPWGTGYPGWHIECSAMATAVLGQPTIDIHTGGEDNIFPHHECEIAQCTGATGEPFARFWMHTRFLLVDGQKMSKSKGNFHTIHGLLEKGADPAAIRLELMRAHYRSNMNFTMASLAESAAQVQRLRVAASALRQRAPEPAAVGLEHPVVERFAGCLADDLNVSGALGELFGWLGGDHDDAAEALGVLAAADSVLGVIDHAADGEQAEGIDAKAVCAAIDEARTAKDYATADRLRAELIEAGYVVLNTADGTVAEKKLSASST